MQFTQATEILRQIEDGRAPRAPFVWRKAWLARRDLVIPALLNGASPLRRIPGLRYSRLMGLASGLWREKPFEIATPADAVQVSESGDRLRAFRIGDPTTLKVVREASARYGAPTLREIALRAEIKKKTGLLVPGVQGHESKNGFLFVREELVEGRSYNVRKDRKLFSEHVIAPLASFYERYGLAEKPLAEALGPLAAFALQDGKGKVSQRTIDLVSANPQVAVGLCHNDIVPSNLAVSRKGVYFLDWGMADMGICGKDFVRIGKYYLNDAGIRERMQAHIAQLQKNRLNLDDMLLLQQLWRQYIER
jgi:hypothetical protein